MGLSTASLLLPVFFAREFLGIESKTALRTVFGAGVYWSWILLGLSILSGIVFHSLSAKWVRLAWEKPVTVFCVPASDNFVEKALEVCFWITGIAFVVALMLIVHFFATYAAHS